MSLTQTQTAELPDFNNTLLAFQNKSDRDLKESYYLFKLMNQPWLVDIGSCVGKYAVKFRLPFADYFMKRTIFKQFCGGTSLLECQDVIDHLYRYNTLTILDYGAEAKSEEEDFEEALQQLLSSIEFAASNNSVPVVSCKLTALVDNELLEKKQLDKALSSYEQEAYAKFINRIETVCDRAYDLKVGIFIDAEESWMQLAMDKVVEHLMESYNTQSIIVYNTYQMYRHDKLVQLKRDHQRAKEKGYILGAKLVRGAYMEKERARAKVKGYLSPIHVDKASVDRDYDAALLYCLDHYEEIAFCCASHNLNSNLLLAREIIDRGLTRDHVHLNFCQLMGMSDYITFNLSQAGFNTAKYVVYGPVKEVVEYLVRRAEENTSVTGEMSRELSLISKEMTRRRLL